MLAHLVLVAVLVVVDLAAEVDLATVLVLVAVQVVVDLAAVADLATLAHLVGRL